MTISWQQIVQAIIAVIQILFGSNAEALGKLKASVDELHLKALAEQK